jgi:cytidylate kinase
MDELDNLVCVLLHGPSGAGKSQTAKLIAAPEGVRAERIKQHYKTFWDYRSLAAPLGEMHTIKTQTVGADVESRQLWLLHQVFTELFLPTSVDFNDFIELIYDTQAYPLVLKENAHGQVVRDRDFMTRTADACHKLIPNVFAKYLTRSIFQKHREFMRQHEDIIDQCKNIVIINDLRLRSELESFLVLEDFGAQVITIRLDVSLLEQDARLLERDNRILTEEQRKHETQISPFTDNDFNLIVNTNDYDLPNQVLLVERFIVDQILKS